MIEKCPACKEMIETLLTREPNPSSTSTTGAATITYDLGITTYPPTSKMYKCSNPKCWVTKITESWE